MRQLSFDLLRLQDGDRQGSYGTRRARGYALAQAAETLHGLGYRSLRARGLKGRHIEALVAEWRRQGLLDGTIRNRLAAPALVGGEDRQGGHRAQGNASYGIGRPGGEPAVIGGRAAWHRPRRSRTAISG